MSYSDYFHIDAQYFPTISLAERKQWDKQWERYYPHARFAELLRKSVALLSDQSSRGALLVRGTYGTGKSHSVLALAELLQAPEEAVQAYFGRYPDQLDGGKLLNDLLSARRHAQGEGETGGTPLVVARIGSSDLHNDAQLCAALQEAIVGALGDNDREALRLNTDREEFLDWLDGHEAAWGDFIKHSQAPDLTPGFVRDTLKGESWMETLGRCQQVCRDNGLARYACNIDRLIEWLTELCGKLRRTIVFIYDEFGNFLANSHDGPDGLQRLAELGKTQRFKLIMVSHLPDKIKDRFDECEIALPDTIALQLLARAMQPSAENPLRDKWMKLHGALEGRTEESRKRVAQWIGGDPALGDTLKGILPIHPYTALLLKHIATIFKSNQRSLFDYAKLPAAEQPHGFLAWCAGHDPRDEASNLLTLDEIFDFLSDNLRAEGSINAAVQASLGDYARRSGTLSAAAQRTLKCVLILQALSDASGGSGLIAAFQATKEHLRLAFDGMPQWQDATHAALTELKAKGAVYETLETPADSHAGTVTVYRAGSNSASEAAAREAEEKKALAYDCQTIFNTLAGPPDQPDLTKWLPPYLQCRVRAQLLPYDPRGANLRAFASEAETERDGGDGRHLYLGLCVCRHDESEPLQKTLAKKAGSPEWPANALLVLAQRTLDEETIKRWSASHARAESTKSSDRAESNSARKQADKVLLDYLEKGAKGGPFAHFAGGEKRACNDLTSLFEEVMRSVREAFKLAQETFLPQTDTVWKTTYYRDGLKQGLDAARKPGGNFSSFANSAPEAWRAAAGEPDYLARLPHNAVSQWGLHLRATIDAGLEAEGSVSLAHLYQAFRKPPYGLLPTAGAAYLMGFLLRPYVAADGEPLLLSENGVVRGAVNTLTNKEELIAGLNAAFSSDGCGKASLYSLVRQTPELQAFLSAVAELLHLEGERCTTSDQARLAARAALRSLRYPLCLCQESLARQLDEPQREAAKQMLAGLLEWLGGDHDSALPTPLTERLGRLALDHPESVTGLAGLLNKDRLALATNEWLAEHAASLLKLATEIDDHGHYVDRLLDKATNEANDSAWLWKKEDWQGRALALTTDYEIARATNELGLTGNHSLDDALGKWRQMANECKMPLDYKELHEALPGCARLLDLLRDLLDGTLDESRHNDLLDAIRNEGRAYLEFVKNPYPTFQKACSFYVEVEEAQEVYKRLLPCTLLKTGVFQTALDKTVKDVRSDSALRQLRESWRQATGTATPSEWAKEHRTPLAPFAPDDGEWKSALSILDGKTGQPTPKQLGSAADYLNNHGALLKRLSDPAQRDEVMRVHVLQEEAAVIGDVEEARKMMAEKCRNVSPLDYHTSDEVRKTVRAMARDKWNRSGLAKVQSRLNGTSADEVKKLLLKLIEDDYLVGTRLFPNDN